MHTSAGEEITANEYIKEGHKIARTDIEKGAEIIKYGVHIGVATQFIKKGDWVHEHNVYDDFEEINREQRAYYRSMAPDAMDTPKTDMSSAITMFRDLYARIVIETFRLNIHCAVS
mgnify:CR=1 FL=1